MLNLSLRQFQCLVSEFRVARAGIQSHSSECSDLIGEESEQPFIVQQASAQLQEELVKVQSLERKVEEARREADSATERLSLLQERTASTEDKLQSESRRRFNHPDLLKTHFPAVLWCHSKEANK